MKRIAAATIVLALTISLYAENLLTKRAGHKTKLTTKQQSNDPMDQPPKEVFKVVKYKTPLGDMSAYLSQHDLNAGEKRPAIVWLTGGFPVSSPGSYLWEETDVSNEQSARIYRNYGVVMMFPLLRGRVKGNPGVVEQFYGEVEDVIAAGKYLKSLSYVDPNRVYLGGHSTGATLAVLVAESTDIFAGTIALGPVSTNYGKEGVPYAWEKKEIYLRSPVNFLAYVKKPLYIIEGEDGNSSSLRDFNRALEKKPNANIRTALINNATHFTIIHPINRVFARAILASKDGGLNIDVRKQIRPAYGDFVREQRESDDLRILANLRSRGMLIEGKHVLNSDVFCWEKGVIESLLKEAGKRQISTTPLKQLKDKKNKTYYTTTLSRQVQIDHLDQVFAASKAFDDLVKKHKLYYDYWYVGK